MHSVQVWLVPALGLGKNGLPSSIEIPVQPPIKMREVDVKVAEDKILPMLLLETAGSQSDVEADSYDDLRRLGRLITRLSFSCLVSFQVVSARLIEGGNTPGAEYRAVAFPGCPPGIALFEGRIGFQQQGILHPPFLSGEVPPAVEQAITWFLTGLTANNPVQQVISFWIGLEALAPLKALPMRCFKCEAQFELCPECGESTLGPAVNKTVGSYLREELGVSPKEARDLYALRCAISHGGLGMDPDSVQSSSEKTARLQEFLLKGIKKALAWPEDTPPLIVPQGWTIVGAPGLMLQGEVPSDANILDHPSVLPA